MSQALEHFRNAQTLAEEIGSKQFLAEALYGIGMVQEANHDTKAACQYYQDALVTAQAVNFTFVVGVATKKIERINQE